MYHVEGVEVVNFEKEMLWTDNVGGPANGGKIFKWLCRKGIIFMLVCSKEQNKDHLEKVTKKVDLTQHKAGWRWNEDLIKKAVPWLVWLS